MLVLYFKLFVYLCNITETFNEMRDIRIEKGINKDNALLLCEWSNEQGKEFQEQWMGPKISYPLDYDKGKPLPEKTAGDIITYYAGAKFAENSRALLSNGGRVYMLVTTADTVSAAQEKIYDQLKKQDTTGLFYRHDIGGKAL